MMNRTQKLVFFRNNKPESGTFSSDLLICLFPDIFATL
jgi:hypothetical protein